MHSHLGDILQKIWRPKTFISVRFLTTSWRDRELSRMQQVIINRKMALQTAIITVYEYLIWWILVHKLRKIGPDFQPTQNQLSMTLLSRVINWGDSSWTFYNNYRWPKTCWCIVHRGCVFAQHFLGTVKFGPEFRSIQPGQPSGWALPRILVRRVLPQQEEQEQQQDEY